MAHFKTDATKDYWQTFQEHTGMSDAEVANFKSDPRKTFATGKMGSFDVQDWTMVIECVYSHGCSAGVKVGDKVYFKNGCSNLDTERSSGFCSSALSRVGVMTSFMHNCLLYGDDPNKRMFANTMSCNDSGTMDCRGCSLGGWGEIVCRAYCFRESEGEDSRDWSKYEMTEEDRDAIIAFHKERAAKKAAEAGTIPAVDLEAVPPHADDAFWEKLKADMDYTDAEIENFKKDPRKVYSAAVLFSEEMRDWTMVAEVVYSHACTAGMKVGDKLYFKNGCRSFDTERSSTFCPEVMQKATQMATNYRIAILHGEDPNQRVYSNNWACAENNTMDINGDNMHGWCQVVMKSYCFRESVGEDARKWNEFTTTRADVEDIAKWNKDRAMK